MLIGSDQYNSIHNTTLDIIISCLDFIPNSCNYECSLKAFRVICDMYDPSTTIGHFVQAPEELDIFRHTGVKGIQGQKNSCYLDATLYGMFAFSNAFDALLLERKCVDSFELNVKSILEQKVVNPLRK